MSFYEPLIVRTRNHNEAFRLEPMKKLTLLIGIVGVAANAVGQGTVILDNAANTSMDSAATSNGLVWLYTGHLWDGSVNNISVWAVAGPTTDSLSPLLGMPNPILESDPRYTGLEPGKFIVTWAENLTLTITGISAGGPAWMKLQLWWSNGGPVYPTYEACFVPGSVALVGEALFRIPATGNPISEPPTTPVSLDAMPAIVLSPVPEPGVFALAGLGLASLLIFRRRK